MESSEQVLALKRAIFLLAEEEKCGKLPTTTEKEKCLEKLGKIIFL